MDFVFSADDSPQHRWQAELLSWSFAKLQLAERGHRLIMLLNGGIESPGFTGKIIPVLSYRQESDPDYHAYRKPGALLEWVWTRTEIADQVCLLEPDCVFVCEPRWVAGRGTVVSSSIEYLAQSYAKYPKIVSRFITSSPEQAAPVGIPMIVNRSDLEPLAQKWYDILITMRKDPELVGAAGWASDMWAYAAAVAHLGILHLHLPVAQFPDSLVCDSPLIHYCTDVPSVPVWHKFDYQPWQTPPEAESCSAMAGRKFLALLHEFVKEKQANVPKPLPATVNS